MDLQEILVPTDFSPPSEPALDAAIELTRKKFEASIVLMHAYQIPVYPYPVAPPCDLSLYVEEAASKQLESVAAKPREHGVGVLTVLRPGAAWEQILRTSKEQRADLIVLGSRGLHGLPRVLLGSTAERVVRHSPVPVLTLHGPLTEIEREGCQPGIEPTTSSISGSFDENRLKARHRPSRVTGPR